MDAFDLRSLPDGLSLEVGYIIQCYHDDRTVRLLPGMVRDLAHLVLAAGIDSLLDRPLEPWLTDTAAWSRVDVSRLNGILRYAFVHFADLIDGDGPDAEFARDLWRATILGIPTVKGTHQIRFDGITHPRLREPVKHWGGSGSRAARSSPRSTSTSAPSAGCHAS